MGVGMSIRETVVVGVGMSMREKVVVVWVQV